MPESQDGEDSENPGESGAEAVYGCIILLLFGACCAGLFGGLSDDDSSDTESMENRPSPEELAKECCLDCGAPWGDGCEFRTKSEARCLMECIDEGSP